MADRCTRKQLELYYSALQKNKVLPESCDLPTLLRSVVKCEDSWDRENLLLMFTILQTVLEQGDIDWRKSVITLLEKEGLVDLLIEMIAKIKSPYVEHVYVKVISSLILVMDRHIVDHLAEMVSTKYQSASLVLKKRYLYVLSALFSKKNHESWASDNVSILFNALMGQFEDLVQHTISISISTSFSVDGDQLLYTFFTLWIYFLKYQQSPKRKNVDNCVYNCKSITECLQKRKLSYNTYIKALDVLRHGVPYSSHICKTENVDVCHQNVATLLLLYYNTDFSGTIPHRTAQGFCATSNQNTECQQTSSALRKMILTGLCACATLCKSYNSDDAEVLQFKNIANLLWTFHALLLKYSSSDTSQSLVVDLFMDQDDKLIEAMLCTVDIWKIVESKSPCASLPDSFLPHTIFISFLKALSLDHSVLLDWLMSTETCFEMYFIKYLKVVIDNWPMFISCCRNFDMNAHHHHQDQMVTASVTKDYNTEWSAPKTNKSACINLTAYSSSESDEDDNYIPPPKMRCLSSVRGKYEDTDFSGSSCSLSSDNANDVCKTEMKLDDSSLEYENSTLDEVMTVFIRLRMIVEKLDSKTNIGFDSESLVNYLEKCEEFYES